MLYKLSLKNITKSFKDYAIYFFTLILGVSIFYVFNAIDSQTALINVSSSTHALINLMTDLLSGVSVFVSFVLGFLVIYASRFLMKRRNKEFGVYMTLGMGKGQISKILFLETLIIGIISLIVGLLIGVVLSQAMSILVANMFETDMTKFEFTFSKAAMIKTIIYFGIMYLLVMIFNTFSVGKCKLIDLLESNKKSEKIKMKNPYLCILVFIISSFLLGYAYYNVAFRPEDMMEENFLTMVAIGCVSTFFIIWSLSGLILKIVMSMKKIYYKDLNSFTLRQISSKINTTVFSMTVICLMLFLTIVVLSSSLSIKNSMTANLKELSPVDITVYKELNVDGTDRLGVTYTKEQIDDSHISVKESLNKMNFNSDKLLKDVVNINVYSSNDLTLKQTLSNSFDQISKEFPYLDYNSKEEIVKLSDYNKLAKLYNQNTYTLNNDEYMIIADFDSMEELRNKALDKGQEINLLGKTYKPKFDECKPGYLYPSANHINTGVIIVPDDAVNENMKTINILSGNYIDNDKENAEALVLDLENNPYIKNTNLNFSTKISIYEASVGLGAIVTFIGLYLGIIFLMSSAAILALKELSESSDNKERYAMLRKIGTDEKMINRALFRQIAIFFLFPLILAIIHSVFGIIFCNYILQTFGSQNLLISIIMTAVFLIIIYGGYFLITYFCSKNIIKENR